MTTLRNGVGAFSSVKLNAAAIINDLAIDELTGEHGLDWFWSTASPAEKLNDFNSTTEQLN